MKMRMIHLIVERKPHDTSEIEFLF